MNKKTFCRPVVSEVAGNICFLLLLVLITSVFDGACRLVVCVGAGIQLLVVTADLIFCIFHRDEMTEKGRAFKAVLNEVSEVERPVEKLRLLAYWKKIYKVSNEEFRNRIAHVKGLENVTIRFVTTPKTSQERFLDAVNQFYAAGGEA